MNRYIIIIIVLFPTCSSKEMRIEDLKFNEVEKYFIKKNNVRESIISYDTAALKNFTFTKSSRWDYKQLLEFCKNGIGTGIIKYDTNGNIISHYIREIMGTDQKFIYDSLGLLTRKIYDTDFRAEYSLRYNYDPKKRELFQIWEQIDRKDSTTYRFNSKGFIISENGHFHDDKSIERTYEKTYSYEKDTLKKTITFYVNDYHKMIKSEENYFYKSNIINQIETKYSYSTINNLDYYPGIIKSIKQFDNKGLPVRLIETNENKIEIIKLIENR